MAPLVPVSINIARVGGPPVRHDHVHNRKHGRTQHSYRTAGIQLLLRELYLFLRKTWRLGRPEWTMSACLQTNNVKVQTEVLTPLTLRALITGALRSGAERLSSQQG